MKEFFYMPIFILFLSVAGCVLIQDQLQVAPPDVIEEDQVKAPNNPLNEWRAAQEKQAEGL